MIISSYSSDGVLNIVHEGKRYTYFGLSPRDRSYLFKLIKVGAIGKAFNFLKEFSEKQQY